MLTYQHQNDDYQPIAYNSQVLTPPKSRYSQTECEAQTGHVNIFITMFTTTRHLS